MKEYKILEAGSSKKLETDVNVLLQDGWKAQGGVVVLQDINERRSPRVKHTYCQALTK